MNDDTFKRLAEWTKEYGKISLAQKTNSTDDKQVDAVTQRQPNGGGQIGKIR